MVYLNYTNHPQTYFKLITVSKFKKFRQLDGCASNQLNKFANEKKVNETNKLKKKNIKHYKKLR